MEPEGTTEQQVQHRAAYYQNRVGKWSSRQVAPTTFSGERGIAAGLALTTIADQVPGRRAQLFRQAPSTRRMSWQDR